MHYIRHLTLYYRSVTLVNVISGTLELAAALYFDIHMKYRCRLINHNVYKYTYIYTSTHIDTYIHSMIILYALYTVYT
jgi:hypothetical protein